MSSPSTCYKCGATDHVATNRNCPRPRKAGAIITLQTPTTTTITLLPTTPAGDNRIKESRQGEDTRFWFYTSDEDGSDRMVESRKIQRVQVKQEVAHETIDSPENEARKKAAPEKQPAAKLQKEPTRKKGIAKSIIRPKTAVDAASIATVPSARPRKVLVPKPSQKHKHRSIGHCKSKSKSPSAGATITATSELVLLDSSFAVNIIPRRLLKNSGPVITQEYLDWCDLPENDPFARKNWKDMEFNYMGARNEVRGDGRVIYQRGIQGWRECRSVGSGLGNPFP